MSSSRGSTSREYSVPLTVTASLIASASRPAPRHGTCPRSADGLAERPGGELPGQVPFVISRAALVRDRAAVVGRELSGRSEMLLARGLADQVFLSFCGRKVGRADRSKTDASVRDHVLVE